MRLLLVIAALLPTLAASADEPIVLELFTSQGCSSCPPADRLLSEVGRDEGIIALAFHVDYWDHLGWRDPYSSPAWSRRQEQYARRLPDGRSYTPQLVLDGRVHLVGSRQGQLEAQIAQRRTEPAVAGLSLSWQQDEKSAGGRRLRIETELYQKLGGSLDLQLAVLESGLDTAVSRGENARRKLHNDFVVRGISTVTSIKDPAPGHRLDHAEIPLDPSWNPDELSVAVLLRHHESLRIFAAARLDARR